jgi:hypothetical protein
MTVQRSGRSGPLLVWVLLIVVWGLFFYWYTSFGGPLSAEEIDRYLARVEQGDRSPVEIEALRTFLDNDSGDDFAMLNVIELREVPSQVPGVIPGESAVEVLDKYMAYMWPALLSRACHPVVFGQAAGSALDLWGIEGGENWSQGALMRYRSRRDMMEIATNPDFAGPHEFKLAAMTKTIAFPVDPWFSPGDPRALLAMVLIIVGLLVTRRSRRY